MERVNGEHLRPLGARRTCAVIDRSGARRRSSSLGRVGGIGGHALGSLRRPATAVDSPHTPRLAQQLAGHGAADRAGRAEYHVQEMVRFHHRCAPRGRGPHVLQQPSDLHTSRPGRRFMTCRRRCPLVGRAPWGPGRARQMPLRLTPGSRLLGRCRSLQRKIAVQALRGPLSTATQNRTICIPSRQSLTSWPSAPGSCGQTSGHCSAGRSRSVMGHRCQAHAEPPYATPGLSVVVAIGAPPKDRSVASRPCVLLRCWRRGGGRGLGRVRRSTGRWRGRCGRRVR